MLHPLISNKSHTKILFFLLLNGKCYAAQLSSRFHAPLTPLQYALAKLEKAGVLFSHLEGKTRFFEFNPSYPLLSELEAFLKKAYTFLPTDQKKLYYSPNFTYKCSRSPHYRLQSASARKTLEEVWKKLLEVKTLSFSAKSKSFGTPSGWNGFGKGNISVEQPETHILIFQERGTWVSEESKQFEFRNAFRWSLKLQEEVIALEHLRFGAQNPVFLFSLAPIGLHTLESIGSHVCADDSYFGQLRCDKHYVQLNWRVIGPKKNEEIDYVYT